MAGIIKNQILKHLSRFAKNLSTDKISLSTFKGEGELTDLQLDEAVLTDLLALPTWMRLTDASCNHAKIRIQWTRLKQTPILLSLDEVVIKVEACEELRAPGDINSTANNYSPGKYGYIEKIIDGITVTVNSVEIQFRSQDFEAGVQISKIRVDSRTPDWKRNDLHYTRLKDTTKGEVLIFKELDWQTLRLEARSTSDRHLAPLRLLTNTAKARIIIKKKLLDCQVVGCRLSLLLDDLLWVLTDSQILAALHFAKSLSGLIKQATEITQKFKAARKLESLPEYQAQLTQSNALKREPLSASGKVFEIFDVKETSYHFVCEQLKLHFCDDPGKGRSKHPDLINGGALELSLKKVMVDFYPYHLARKETRKNWPQYTDNPLAHWLQQALTAFRIELIEALCPSMHSPLARTQQQQQQSSSEATPNILKNAVVDQLAKLMSTCLIVKVYSFDLFKVSIKSKEVPPPFVSCYFEKPQDMPTIHAEFSHFYYPGEICFPIPSPKIYAHFHPIQINLDLCTVLWLNAFVSNISNVMSSKQSDYIDESADYVDIRLELIQPKLVFENNMEYKGQKDRPNSAHIQVARIVISNFRSNETGTLHQLTQCLDGIQRGDLVYGSDFPSNDGDTPLVPEKFILHAEGRDKIRAPSQFKFNSFRELAPYLTKEQFWTEPRDVWYASMDPLWIDFRKNQTLSQHHNPPLNSSTPEPRSQSKSKAPKTTSILYPFVDSLPLSVWIYMYDEKKNKKPTNEPTFLQMKNNLTHQTQQQKKKIHAILNGTGNVNVQLTHYQFLFLLRMLEAIGELSLYLTYDLENIVGKGVLDDLVTVLGILPSVDLSLLFPAQTQTKQDSSPSLELNSIIPSSSGEVDNEMNQEEGDKEFIWKLDIEREKGPTISLDIKKANPSESTSVSNSPMPVNLFPHHSPGNISSHMEEMASSMASSLRIGVKHGLNLAAVSFTNIKGSGLATPDSEVWSNFSSDSSESNFIHIEKDIGTPAGDNNCCPLDNNIEVDDNVEVATEVLEEDRNTPSPLIFSRVENSIIRAENENIIGVITIRLDQVEFAQEAKGLNTTLKFQTKSIFMKECMGINFNEFQAKFGTRNKIWGEQPCGDAGAGPSLLGSPSQRRAIKARLSQNINLEEIKEWANLSETQSLFSEIRNSSNSRINLTDRPGGDSPIRKMMIDFTNIYFRGCVDLQNSEEFVIHMSSLMSLADFVEDEFVPSPFPLKLDIIGARLELIEDRPSANITSPGPVPIKVSIPNKLPISRTMDGIFFIGLDTNNDVPSDKSGNVNQLQQQNQNGQKQNLEEIELLKSELEKIVRQLDTTQKRNAHLEDEVSNMRELKLMVHQLQERCIKLQEEKVGLLDIINSYQKLNHRK